VRAAAILVVFGLSLWVWTRRPVLLLFLWIATAPIIENIVARPNISPLFRHRDIVGFSYNNVPGFRIWELFTVDRLVLLLCLAAVYFRHHRQHVAAPKLPSPRSLRFRTLYAAFATLIFVSALHATNVLHALNRTCDTVILCYVAYLIGFMLVSDDRQQRSFQSACIFQGLLLSMIGIIEHFKFAPDSTYRISGPFPFWEDLGMAVAVALLMLLGRIEEGGHKKHASLAWCGVGLMAAVVYLTQTRTVMLSLFMGFSVSLVVGRKSIAPVIQRVFWASLAVVAAVMIFAPQLLTANDMYQRRLSNLDTFDWREGPYIAAGRMMSAHPLLGVGLRSSRDELSNYLRTSEAEHTVFGQSSLHSTYLVVGAEAGVPTLIVYVLVLASMWRVLADYAVQAPSRNDRVWGLAVFGVFILLITSGFLFDTFFEPTVCNKVVFVAFGIIHARWIRLQGQAEPQASQGEVSSDLADLQEGRYGCSTL